MESGAMTTVEHNPGFLAVVAEAKQRIRETDVAEVKRRMDDGESITLVDVREDCEWEKGHIPGAVHLSRGTIERDVETLFPDKTAELVVYCGGGFRSALAADTLRSLGYTSVISMDGGARGWDESGHVMEGIYWHP